LPEPPPGSLGDDFMAPPPKAKGGARSQWASDVTGRRSGASSKAHR
jgi:hypothetical protein